jgi:hypothetical protein
MRVLALAALVWAGAEARKALRQIDRALHEAFNP